MLGSSRDALIFAVGRGVAWFGGRCSEMIGFVDSDQPSFTDVEYGNRRRVSRREKFLETMDATIPWQEWVGLIEPHYYGIVRASGAVRPGRWRRCCGCICCRCGFRCRMRAWRTRSTTRMRCVGSCAWTSRSSRYPTRPRCCTSGTCWRSTSLGRSCSRRRTGSSSGGLDHARRFDHRRHDHRCPVLDEERHRHTGSGDAPDPEGQPVVLRDEGPRRGRCRHRLRTHGDRDRRERA